MPIPLVELETASYTYKHMARLLPRRFRKRSEGKQSPSDDGAEVSVLGTRRANTAFSAEVKDLFLEPRNPFDSQAKRKPRREIALVGGLAFALFAVFVASSFIAR